MADKYGPNTKQVENFVERLRHFTSDDCDRVKASLPLARAAYGDSHSHLVQVEAMGKYGYRHEKEWLLPATDKLHKVVAHVDPQFQSVAAEAVMGLVLCEVMAPHEFAAWYGPFADVVLIQALGDGIAPPVQPPPARTWQRFLTRVKALEAPEWERVVEVGLVTIEAVGQGAYEAAYDATQLLAKVLTKHGPIPEDEVIAMGSALDEVNELGCEYIEKMGRLYGTFDRFLGRSLDWTNHVAGNEELVKNFRAYCFATLAALFFREPLTPQQFAILYLPFSGVVSLKSLEVA